MRDLTIPDSATEAQRSTIEMLVSEIEIGEIARLQDQALGLPEDGDELVFEGDGADGPVVGTIDTDGGVEWLVGG